MGAKGKKKKNSPTPTILNRSWHKTVGPCQQRSRWYSYSCTAFSISGMVSYLCSCKSHFHLLNVAVVSALFITKEEAQHSAALVTQSLLQSGPLCRILQFHTHKKESIDLVPL